MPSRPLSSPPTIPPPTDKTRIIFLILIISSSAVILCTILYFLYHLCRSLSNTARTIPFDSTSPLKLQRFSYKELKNATNDFDDANVIGKGGSATVFRGITQDGKLFAIKRLDAFSLQTEREFQNELQILGGLRSPFLVTLLGYCVEKTKRLLVYEYMPNKSLQESLFGVGSSDGGGNLSLNWQRRFNVILDIARAIEFLHFGCDPPVIHGDIKPSNVLLQSDFKAKLSDFGLSRIKVEGEFGMDLFSQELSGHLGDHTRTPPAAAIGIKTPPVSMGNNITTTNTNNEVDFALALQASSSSKNNVYSWNWNLNSLHYNSSTSIAYDVDCKSTVSAKGKEINAGDDWNDDEFCSTENNNSTELKSSSNLVIDEEEEAAIKKQWGKDWWWRQDGSGELCSKDYVTEWIGSQICPSTNPDWDDDSESKKTNPEKNDLEKLEDAHEPQRQEVSSKKKESKGRKKKNKRHRKMQEWWKEEHLAEMSRKSSKKGFKVSRYAITKLFHFHKRNNFGGQDQDDCSANGEFSFRRGWKRKNKNCNRSDMWSGDLFSRELSSTTSMRGTLCYVAPEYGGCGYLMEKADIYSFGVLILVIVSGRRPLHVLASPMKLEKANLITWSRHLAQSGNILELVDEKLKDEYNKEQASLCINLALICLQKIPELRPDIAEIIRILNGEMDLPPLPMEFSPSPPSKLYNRSWSRSRSWNKEKANAE